MTTYRIDIRYTDSTDRSDVIGFGCYLEASSKAEAEALGRQRAARSHRPAELESVRRWL